MVAVGYVLELVHLELYSVDLEIFTARLSLTGHRMILADSLRELIPSRRTPYPYQNGNGSNPHERPNFHLTFCYTKAKKGTLNPEEG